MKTVNLPVLLMILLTGSGLVFGQSGTISGFVKFDGTKPTMKPYKVTYNNDVCGNSKSLDRLVIVNDSLVQNCVVYIEGAKRKAERTSPSKYVLDQKDCGYIPHVLDVDFGDAFTVLNSDPLFHNVHGYFAANHSTAFNIAEPVKGMKTVQRVRKPGMYLLECDVHPWMNAYVYVSGDGYSAVTGDDGTFKIADVPPGKYKLTMWHEGWDAKIVSGKPEYSKPIEITQEVTVEAGKTSNVVFSLK